MAMPKDLKRRRAYCVQQVWHKSPQISFYKGNSEEKRDTNGDNDKGRMEAAAAMHGLFGHAQIFGKPEKSYKNNEEDTIEKGGV